MDGWRQLMEMSDEELATVDVAEQHLLCAEGLPGAENLNVSRNLSKIDEWTEHVRKEIRDYWHLFRRNPAEFRNSENYYRVLTMITVLQQDLGVFYRPDLMDDPLDWRDSRAVFLHGLLSGFGGTCTSMPALYVAIGRRLGFPLHMVSAKAHFFCRWDDGKERFNIEGASQGMHSHPDEHYHNAPLPLTQLEISKGCYLYNQSPREALATFLAQRGGCLQDHQQYYEAVKMFHHANRVFPDHPVLEACHAVGTILHLVTSGRGAYKIEKRTNRLVGVCIDGTWRPPEPWEPAAVIAAQKEHQRIRLINEQEYQPAT